MKKIIISKLCISIVGLFLLFGCATTSGTKEASAGKDIPVITDIHIEDGAVVIKSNKSFTYTMYNPNDPYKITIEIPDMSIGAFTGKIVSDKSGVTEISSRQTDSPHLSSWIDITLQTPSTISPSYEDNTLVLSIKKEQPVVQSESKNITSEAVESQSRAVPLEAVGEPPVRVIKAVDENIQPLSKATEITAIELIKAADSLKVLITGNGAIIPNVFPINERIVVDIPDVTLHTTLPETVISPLKGIRAGKHKGKVRLVLDLKEKTNFDVIAIGNAIEIALLTQEMPAAEAPEPVADKTPLQNAIKEQVAKSAEPAKPIRLAPEPETLIEGEFTGKKISLDFQDADIIPIFRLIGDISGYNVVVNPAVKGNITLKLINVPWDQALDIILRTFSLSKIVDGNIIRIVPTSVVAKELDDLSRAKKARDEAGDLRTKVFPINYADLANLKDAIDKAKILSSRGNVTLDERASTIIVNDLERNLEQIDILIRQLDQEQMQARQVMIEAKIVEVTATYTKDLGIQWNVFYTKSDGKQSGTIGSSGRSSSGSPPPPYMVNLPTSLGTTGQIGFGYINKAASLALDLQLSAMEQLQKGKVISSPRIMTMNNKEAKIMTGSTLYLQSTASGSNVASFTAVDAVLSLTVKPRIAPGGAIFMDLDITKDEPTGPPTPSGTSILKNAVKTSVLVSDSDTIVIGGIFKKSETSTTDSVPGFSKIPLLGRLFQKDNKIEDNTEVLIFITPRILEFSTLK
ncbi:MAG: type 4 fimbrial biosis outer membrane protein PilQ [Bacteroidetes bacterium]|nr:type 4 fimbrial biosis outer membrane protein PilQ [Bacteroidota bacterium]